MTLAEIMAGLGAVKQSVERELVLYLLKLLKVSVDNYLMLKED